MAGIWSGGTGGILAVLLIHASATACNHGAVRGRGGEFMPLRIPQQHGDGEWAFRRGGIRKSFLLPEPAGGGLGQQLGSINKPDGIGGSSGVLRY